MKPTLEQAATSPDAERLAEKAVCINKQTMSAIIQGPDTIVCIPNGAKGVKGKSGMAHFDLQHVNSHMPIPEGAMYVQYTGYYRRHSYIEYGPPTFYDEHGNMVSY